jgi:hypothetical protein
MTFFVATRISQDPSFEHLRELKKEEKNSPSPPKRISKKAS